VTIDAVVFDMDGLMLDTEPLYKAAWQAGCRECGYELTDAVYATLVGRPTPACEQVLMDTFGVGFPLDRFQHTWPSLWRVAATNGIQHKPGLLPLLAFLRERAVRTAVATSSEASFTEFSLGQAGLLHRFDVVVTGDLIARGKPAPDIYLAAAGQLGVAPHRCVALEDSEAGIVAASAAGMVAVLVPDWVPPSAVAQRAASQVFPSLVEARVFIEGWLDTPIRNG
jgi:HAD superfamily hydrolase (TIGR01509 family)